MPNDDGGDDEMDGDEPGRVVRPTHFGETRTHTLIERLKLGLESTEQYASELEALYWTEIENVVQLENDLRVANERILAKEADVRAVHAEVRAAKEKQTELSARLHRRGKAILKSKDWIQKLSIAFGVSIFFLIVGALTVAILVWTGFAAPQV